MSPTRGYVIFSKNKWLMLYIHFFERNQLRRVPDNMSETSKPCSSTSTTSTRLSPTRGYIFFQRDILQISYIQFSKRNWLKRARGMSESSILLSYATNGAPCIDLWSKCISRVADPIQRWFQHYFQGAEKWMRSVPRGGEAQLLSVASLSH